MNDRNTLAHMPDRNPAGRKRRRLEERAQAVVVRALDIGSIVPSQPDHVDEIGVFSK